jgi:hypothetical protein
MNTPLPELFGFLLGEAAVARDRVQGELLRECAEALRNAHASGPGCACAMYVNRGDVVDCYLDTPAVAAARALVDR